MEQACLVHTIDGRECASRNALVATPPHLVLTAGSIGTIVDRLDDGDAFLVEFGSRGPTECDWLGVLYASEIEPVAVAAKAA